MQRLIIGLMLVAMTLGSLTACSKPDGGGEGGGDAGLGRAFLSIGTAPAGGTFFVIGGAMGEVLNNNKGENQWEFTAEATKGTQENIRRLDRGELDLALANAAISYFAVRGEGRWDKSYEVRTVMTLAPNVAMFVTPQGSGVTTLADLKGKRVSVGPAGAGFEYFVGPLLEAHGVTYDDFTPVNGTQTQAVDYLADGSVAAAFLGGGVPTPSITQAATSQEILLLPFDEAAKQQLVDDYLFFNPAEIAAGTYRGQDEVYKGLDVGSMQLITSADKADELIYQLTKTLYEARDQVAQRHPAARAINANNVVRDTGTPFHPGAIRYYREIGIWPADRE